MKYQYLYFQHFNYEVLVLILTFTFSSIVNNPEHWLTIAQKRERQYRFVLSLQCFSYYRLQQPAQSESTCVIKKSIWVVCMHVGNCTEIIWRDSNATMTCPSSFSLYTMLCYCFYSFIHIVHPWQPFKKTTHLGLIDVIFFMDQSTILKCCYPRSLRYCAPGGKIVYAVT